MAERRGPVTRPRSAAREARGAESGRAKPRHGSTVTPAALRRSQPEASFQRQVTDLLHSRGWLWYHANLSIRDRRGFPDLIACRRDRLLAVELKSANGKPTEDQLEWLVRLSLAGAEVHIWKPDDWAKVDEVTR